jgi:hypothetical protein
MRKARLLPSLAAAALALAPGVALGNGRFPATIDVHFKPGDPDVIALQATWGLITTFDGGDTWHWSCEEAVGFAGIYDPDYQFTSTGLLFATTTTADALRQTRDMCTWTPAAPPLGPDGATPAKFVSQVAVGPTGAIFVATPYELAPEPQIYRSTDDGVSWTPLSRPIAGTVDWWESMEIAPTLLAGSQTRIYATGYGFVGPDKVRYLVRSDNGGATWTDLGVDEFTFNHENADLQIAAISPTDPDLVFARVYRVNNAIGDDIYRSDDAGVTWVRVFQSADDVTAVVVRESGQVVVTTGLSGVHVSADGGQTFGASIDDTKVQCLKERDDQLLFVCGVSFPPDNMGLGTGTTVGDWTSILTFADVTDAYECAGGTTQQDVCYDLRWCATACQFGITAPECSCGFDAGVVAPDAGIDAPPGKTCCGTGDPSSAALLALLVAAPLARRRKRRVIPPR